MPKEIRVELKLRNNLILARMEELGIRSVRELCCRAGKPTLGHQSIIGKIINLKKSPLCAGSNPLQLKWNWAALAICEVLFESPEDLFPEAILANSIDPSTKLHFEVSFDELRKLGMGGKQHLLVEANQERELEKSEILKVLMSNADCLSPNQRKVILLRYGFEDGEEHTFEEISKVLGVSRSRAKAIESRALNRLRSPVRLREIASACGVNISE